MTAGGEVVSFSEEDTFRKGEEFGASLKPGDKVILSGPLGSGKTCFVKGICSHFGISDQVSSPTFIIVNEYEGVRGGEIVRVVHFDLYRIRNTSELDEIGPESYFTEDTVVLIEWGEIAGERFPQAKTIQFSYGKNENERIINFY